jgi:hypothetical protein
MTRCVVSKGRAVLKKIAKNFTMPLVNNRTEIEASWSNPGCFFRALLSVLTVWFSRTGDDRTRRLRRR